jgi:isocitrate lyase
LQDLELLLYGTSLIRKDLWQGLGALTGNQAIQEGWTGILGWQVAADANVAGEMYPDNHCHPAIVFRL